MATIKHDYLTDASGDLLSFDETKELCPQCPAIPGRRRQLGVRTSDGRTETVMCVSCDFLETRERRLAPGRLMNGGSVDKPDA